MQPKRVCIIGPMPPYKGGIAHYNDALARHLETEHEVKAYSFSRQYPKFLIKREQKDTNKKEPNRNCEYTIDSINPLSWEKTAKKIIENNPDIVILPWWVTFWLPMYLFFFARLKQKKIKTFLICHNVHEHESNFIKRMASKTAAYLSDYVLVHSSAEKSKLGPKLQNKTLVHLHPIYEFNQGKPHRIRSEGDEKELKVLFFGFIRKYKGLDLLLKSLSILKDNTIHLTIAGEFWYEKDEYLRLAELSWPTKIDIIDHYIPNEEIDRLFEECDVVALPYRSATGSGVLATAYGYKKPVLVTEVGGLPEAVVNGKTGLITKPNPADLANGLTWFKEHKGLDFPAEIQKFTETKMSWKGLCKTIEEAC